jgi:hypothetical protein
MSRDRRDDDRNRGGGGADSRDEREQKAWKQHSTKLPGTSGHRLWLNKDGGVAGRDSDINTDWMDTDDGMGWRYNRQATAHSADKLNRYLERSGNSLRGGKGAPIVDYKEVHLEPTRTGGAPWMWARGGAIGDGELPGGKEFVPIYGARPERERERDRDRDRKRPESPQEPTASTNHFGGSDAANEAINSGLFDVPARPTWGEEFLRDYTSRATGSDGINSDAPIMQSSTSPGSIRDGYPSSSDWTPPRTDGSESWNVSPGGTPEDNEELSRTFAASAAFRDRLNAMVMA